MPLRRIAPPTAEALRLYAEHLDASPEILDRFTALLADLHAQAKRPCLICLERDPAECHRAILAERWAAGEPGRSVRHLRFADARRARKSS